jgi:hypothetical protein
MGQSMKNNRIKVFDGVADTSLENSVKACVHENRPTFRIVKTANGNAGFRWFPTRLFVKLALSANGLIAD